MNAITEAVPKPRASFTLLFGPSFFDTEMSSRLVDIPISNIVYPWTNQRARGTAIIKK